MKKAKKAQVVEVSGIVRRCPVITAFLDKWQPLSNEDETRIVLPLIRRAVGSFRGDHAEAERSRLCAEWITANMVPHWLGEANLMMGQAGCNLNNPGYIQALKSQTDKEWDAVSSATRTASPRGAQEAAERAVAASGIPAAIAAAKLRNVTLDDARALDACGAIIANCAKIVTKKLAAQAAFRAGQDSGGNPQSKSAVKTGVYAEIEAITKECQADAVRLFDRMLIVQADPEPHAPAIAARRASQPSSESIVL